MKHEEKGTILKNGHIYRTFSKKPLKARLYHACKRFGNPCTLPDVNPEHEEGMAEL